MIRFFLMVIVLTGLAVTPALADLKYYPDPVYQKFNPEDASPMEDMGTLAEKGDVRAQFILGDLYSKGKGGVAKDLAEARRWFEESAMHDYNSSFIRLAALAKRVNKPAEAWQWYSLAIKGFDSGDERRYVIQARHDLVESAGLSQDDIRQARQSMGDWEDMRDKKLSDEKKAAIEQRNKETAAAGENLHEQDKSKNTNR